MKSLNLFLENIKIYIFWVNISKPVLKHPRISITYFFNHLIEAQISVEGHTHANLGIYIVQFLQNNIFAKNRIFYCIYEHFTEF